MARSETAPVLSRARWSGSSARVAVAAIGAAALLAGAPLHGQGKVLEFGDRTTERDRLYQHSAQEVETAAVGWRTAWERDDAEALARFYANDATLYMPDGRVLEGRRAIRDYFEAALPRSSQIVTRRSSFDVTSGLATEGRHISYRVSTGEGADAFFSGSSLTVFERAMSGDWVIETQMLEGAEERGEAAAQALAGRRAQVVVRDAAFVPARTGVTLSVGTLGVGLEAGYLPTTWLGLRAGAHLLPRAIGFDYTAERVTYGTEIQPRNFTVLLDLYPMPRGGFHLTGGLVANQTEWTAVGQPSELDRFVVDGRIYTTEEVGELTAEISFPSVAPYAGIGIKPLNAGLGFEGFADLGVAFGGAELDLRASRGAGNPELQADLEAERESFQESLDSFPFYPVFTWGLTYRF